MAENPEGIVYLLLGGFLVYRLSIMIARDLGPLGAFDYLRYWIFKRFGADSWITDGIHCPSCVGFWLSLPLGLVFGSSPFGVILWWIGIAGMITFMWRMEIVLSTPVQIECEDEDD